jgi:D-alanyl-D-alanine carboxypeptidase
MRKSLTLLSLFMAFACSVLAQTINKSRLDSLLNILAENNKAMGSLALAVDGRVIYQKATGFIALNNGVKTNADVKTKYRIGSISKMFTGVLVLQLIEEGKLSLATPLSKYYPQLPNAAKITIDMMLRHRSGLHNFTNDSLYTTYKYKPATQQTLVNIFAKQRADFEPDAKAEYSNTNFVILGFIAEKVTGKTYADLIKTRIVNKLGLPDTYYGRKADVNKDEAISFSFADAWKPEPETNMSVPAGAGAIISTPTDLAQFITALFNGKLVNDSSLNVMKTMKDGFGLAMVSYSFGDKKGFGHDGAIDAFRSILTYYPEEKLAIAYIANGDSYGPKSVALGALSTYFKTPFTFPSFTSIVLKSEDLDKYLGIYSSTQLPLKITISKNNTTLMAQATGQDAFLLEAPAKDQFVFNQAGIELLFDTSKAEMTLNQGGETFLFTRDK